MRLELVVDGRKKEQDQNAIAVAEVLIQAFDLFVAKSEGYGATWRTQGWMGNTARILSKANRLKAMLWKDDLQSAANGEDVLDTALDLINLSAFFIVNAEDGNKWGESA